MHGIPVQAPSPPSPPPPPPPPPGITRVVSAGAMCLAGPTASGKSALAMALAQHLADRGLKLEIISVDSALVYIGMDIGTAKPSAAERARVPHHLIDLLDPSQAYSAARFVADCQRALSDIRARGALPLLVGGTMMYFKALREGLHVLPAANPAVRAQIDLEAAQRGWPALHTELALVDPQTAARLSSADSQRIQRALEVWRSSGRALSSWQQGERAGPGISARASASAWPMLSLEPLSRAWLHHRIEQRLTLMFEQGLVDEVVRLRRRGDLHLGLPSMRCVGYRQVWQALEAQEQQGSTSSAGGPASAWQAAPIATMATMAATAATRQLAKRQLTWLRSTPSREVLACDELALAPDGGANQAAVQALSQRLLAHESAVFP